MPDNDSGYDEAQAAAIHVYEIDDQPGARLCLGVPVGQKRPAIWITQDGLGTVLLGRFNGPREMLIAVNFLDNQIGIIQRVITHLNEQRDDDDNEWKKPKG